MLQLFPDTFIPKIYEIRQVDNYFIFQRFSDAALKSNFRQIENPRDIKYTQRDFLFDKNRTFTGFLLSCTSALNISHKVWRKLDTDELADHDGPAITIQLMSWNKHCFWVNMVRQVVLFYIPGVCEPPLTEFCLRANGLWMNITGCKSGASPVFSGMKHTMWLFTCASVVWYFAIYRVGKL